MTVAIPSVGMYRTPDHRYYFNGAGPFPGVTSILGIIDKPALVEWAKRETAECAIRNLDLLDGLRSTGGDRLAVEWLKRIPDYQRDEAANRGTRVHAAADAYVNGRELDLPIEDMPFLDAYRLFLERHNVSIVAAELAVIGQTPYGYYGGTLDLIADVDTDGELEGDAPGRHRWLIDIKTSKGTYRETALQLAAYGMAGFAGFAGDVVPYELPAVERYGVLHIRPDIYPTSQDGGYRLIEYEVGPGTRAAFEAAYGLSQWLTGPNPKRGNK